MESDLLLSYFMSSRELKKMAITRTTDLLIDLMITHRPLFQE